MPEAKFDLSKVTFEDVLDPAPMISSKQPDVVLPEKDKVVEDKTAVVPPVVPVVPKPEIQAEETTFYQDLTKLIGYEIEGEFDESVEGVAEYTKAVGQKIAEEEVKDLFSAYPDVKEYLQFRLNNGDPAKYFETKYGEMDYSKYNVSENDETTQEVIIRKYLNGQGHPDAEINETIKDYKETNLLFKMAKKAADRLIDSQKSRREGLISKQAEEARQAETEREEMVGEISDVIEKGSLHNLMIPEKDRKDFRAWLLQPDAKGKTRRQETMAKLTLQQKLELEYLAFRGFDLKDLIKKEATQTRVDFLKKSVSTKGSRLAGVPDKTKPSVSNLTGIKLTDLGF